MLCRYPNCDKSACKGKVYCNKHLQGQRVNNPVHGTSSTYGTLTPKSKKKKKGKK